MLRVWSESAAAIWLRPALDANEQPPLPVGWRDATGTADPALTPIDNIPDPSPDAYVWPRELQHNGFFHRQGGAQPGGDDTVGDFASLKQMLTEDADLQDLLIRGYQYVIVRYDVDGFRIDTLRYHKGDLPRLFGNAIREYALAVGKENFVTSGEVFDAQAEQDIARFIGRTRAMAATWSAWTPRWITRCFQPQAGCERTCPTQRGRGHLPAPQADRARRAQLTRRRHPVLRHLPGQP